MSSPSFQFYPADFLADENVVMMSNQEIGCYMKLMCYCWREGSIPSDISRIARLCGEDSLTMAELWIAISSCFEAAIDDSSRLIHPRLVRELKKQEDHKKERSDSGKKGAKARWGNAYKGNGLANSSAIKEPMANDGFSSSTSTSVITSSNEEVEAIKESPPPAKEKSRRGTKLPIDFRMPSDWLSEAQGHMRCSVNAVNADFDAFIHYYTNGKGKNESCIDWLMTWRNWYRKPYSSCSKETEARPNATHQKTDNSVPAKIERAIAERNARRQAEGAGPSPGTVIDGQFERIPF